MPMSEAEWKAIFDRLEQEFKAAKYNEPGSARVKEIMAETAALRDQYKREKAEIIKSDLALGKPLPAPKVVEYLKDESLRKAVAEEAARRNDMYGTGLRVNLRDLDLALQQLAQRLSGNLPSAPAKPMATPPPMPAGFMNAYDRIPYGEREVELMNVINALQKKLQEQDAALQALAQPPFARGTVVKSRTKGNYAMVSVNGQIMELSLPPEMQKEVKTGSQLRINIKTGAAVDIIEGEPAGHIVTVLRLLDKESIEVEFMGGPRAVTCSFIPGPTKGDRVMVNDGVHVVLKCLGKLEDVYQVEEAVNVPWDAIGGQKTAKTEMIEAIEGPVRHAEIFKAYGKQPIKGILLYGPQAVARRCWQRLLPPLWPTCTVPSRPRASST